MIIFYCMMFGIISFSGLYRSNLTKRRLKCAKSLKPDEQNATAR